MTIEVVWVRPPLRVPWTFLYPNKPSKILVVLIFYMIKYADVIVDLQAGDTGKGKVCNSLSQNGEYTHIIRYNGGGNAGHTIYKDGVKMVTHFIPSGIVNGVKSIIGPGCVIDPNKFLQEIKDLEEKSIQVKGKLFIDKRVHIITSDHLEEDGKDVTIGTTKTGNGPAYRDKYYRKGVRVEGVESLKEFCIDIYQELHEKGENKILFEGAQGFELDIDWGDYPYGTSSHCTVGSAILNGVPPQSIRKVYGIAKAYQTYVGQKQFEEPSEIFDEIRRIGNEYGATTGRKRQIDWINLDNIIKACNINGVTDLIINKLDVMSEVGVFRLYDMNKLIEFENEERFMGYIKSNIKSNCQNVSNIQFSLTPYHI